ncbi:ABC transporter permease [Spirosoma foliorum]|uniref:ABC transporter permease n=1 Tax=Spirosoma foliorum TaxID=2710596 RepID=A0A7G5GW77_9BACT|nr:ABC transporter permease [Spirosoma foliorum]QMW03119.1 ABC transporter permease [Spirosoma foliorum]
MLLNYLKIAFRNLSKNRVFSLINIAGLALGIAAFVLILEYISFEKSYNQFHQNLANTYRILLQHPDGKSDDYVPSAIATALKKQFSEVKAACRIASVQQGVVTVPETGSAQAVRSFRETNSLSADGDFFRIFSFPLVAGSSSLYQPNTVAISQTKAKAYFGAENPIGKILTLNSQFGKLPYTIVGVFADVPANSDLQFDIVYSLSTLDNEANRNGNDWVRLDRWEGSFSQTMILLDPQADPVAFEAKANQLISKARPKTAEITQLQPLTYIHLGDGLSDARPTSGKVGFVYMLGGIAFLILVIAWLNYINLSTAGALKRAKEVGVRKVVGANRGQIIGQFLGESLLLNVLGLGLAILLIALFQSPFNELIDKNLSLTSISQSPLWIVGAGAVLLGAIASGSYAAFALSRFPVISIVKNAFVRSGQGVRVRQTLVVFQFSISIVLMVATVVLYRQLAFMQSQDLGINVKQLLVIKGADVGADSARRAGKTTFRNELASLPYVNEYCNSGSVPGGWYNFNSDGVTRLNPVPGDEKKEYAFTYSDDRFLPTYGIKLVAGQNFTPDMCAKGTDANRVLINEKAVKSLGFASAQEAVGQKIKFGSELEVIGVIHDYHHQSLQQAIQPLIIYPGYPGSNYTIRLATDNMQAKIGDLEKLYKQLFPGNPFEYYFVDEHYNKQYQTEQQYSSIFSLASGLAILIACLGLFGLAAYATEQRTKEIGVRKVLGASVGSIITLLSGDFLKLVAVAILIASPIAGYAMNNWLQAFAYKIDIEWWMFALAGLLAVGIALLTVSLQSIKAALMNPVKSLRSE